MSDKKTCAVCLTGKATLECGYCQCALCKSCAEFLSENEFQYMEHRPQKLSSLVYCYNCHISTVVPEVEKYQQMLAKAEDVRIFDKSQTKETRLMKRAEKPLYVQKCADPQEATMKLAYLAASKNFNALIEVDIKTVKVREGSYQTSECSATGIPTNISDFKIQRDRKIRGN